MSSSRRVARHKFAMANALPGLIAFLASALLAGCSQMSSLAQSTPERHDARTQLSIGYSQLYQEAKGIPTFKWLLMLKEKSPEMAELTDGLIAYYRQLAARMEKLSGEFPAMRIDVTPMSPIEAETRKALGEEQAKAIAPVVGQSGLDFERQALLVFYDALDEERQLVGVMIGLETDPALRKFLESTRRQLDERYEKTGALLNRRYFAH